MSKMDILIAVHAKALDVPEGVVVSRWTALRRGKEWTPAVRGTPRPDPDGYDAGRLLLAFLGGGQVGESAETVRALRTSIRTSPRHLSHGDEPLAVSGIDANDAETLGGLLGSILTALAEHGELRVDQSALRTAIEKNGRGPSFEKWPLAERGRITDCNLRVSRGPLGWRASIDFTAQVFRKPGEPITLMSWQVARADAGDVAWTLSYSAIRTNRLSRTNPSEAAPDRQSEESVSYRTLKAIGASLRGDEAAANAALSWKTRTHREIRRYEFLEPDYRPWSSVDSAGIFYVVEPDYQWLQFVVDNADQPNLWAPEEPRPELVRQWVAAAKAALDRRAAQHSVAAPDDRDAKPRRDRGERDRRYAAAARRRKG